MSCARLSCCRALCAALIRRNPSGVLPEEFFASSAKIYAVHSKQRIADWPPGHRGSEKTAGELREFFTAEVAENAETAQRHFDWIWNYVEKQKRERCSAVWACPEFCV